MSFATRLPVTGISGGLRPRGITTLSTPPIMGGSLPLGGATSGGGFLSSLGGPAMGIAQGLVGDLLGSLNIGENIKLVKEYGISSWGASTSPDKELKEVSEFVVPIISDKMQQMNEQNVSETLSWLDGFIMFTYTAFKHLREHHARAGSTKAAYDEVMSFCVSMRKKSIDTVVNELKSSGFTVSKTSRSEDFNVLENTYQHFNGRKFDSNHKYNVRWNVYNITAPVSIPNTSNPPKSSDGNVKQPSNGSGEDSSGNGLVGLGLKALGLYMASKLF